MNTIDCEVIRDLLPLYIDRACSLRTAEVVEEHLKNCPECKAVLKEMAAPMPAENPPAFGDKEVFRSVRRSIFGIIIAAAVMLSCFVINVGGAWMGGPASAGQLAVTILYCIFWGVFTVASRNFGPLVRVSFVISLLTFLSAFNSLVWVLLGGGGFITAFLSVFASVPFYGLRFFLQWEGLYAVATAISILWLVYTGVNLRKLKQTLSKAPCNT